MSVVIQTIPHNAQRYPTVGDWVWVDDHNLVIHVSHMDNRDYEDLVAVHELIEAILCRKRGITTEMADAFDADFEKKNLTPFDNIEPGNDPRCPYRHEHFVATIIEMMLAHELGVDWSEYDAAVNAL
jgi:hypothetical protein